MVGIVAGLTILFEFLGGVLAIHNIRKYLYLQRRYVGSGMSLVIFYTLAVLIFSLRIV